jgi:hypothetical protein
MCYEGPGGESMAKMNLEKLSAERRMRQRGTERLRYEMTTALGQEAKYRSALSDVKTTVQDVDPWDNAPSL